MAGTSLGLCHWSLTRDANGHRDYKAIFKVLCARGDGPLSALLASGLPRVGDPWSFGNEFDLWVWCRPDARVQQLGPEDEQGTVWTVEFTFANTPSAELGGGFGGLGGGGGSGGGFNPQRCSEANFEDPLLEPPRVSGSFTKYTAEATHDRFGRPVLSSSLEQLRGPTVEFDRNRPTVRIEQNVLTAFQAITLPATYMDRVNSTTLWGLPPRCVKLSSASWERRYYGTCYGYYNRVLEFDIDFQTWDRYALDEGTKVLHGRWGSDGTWELLTIGGVAPDRFNPNHFDRFQDRQGNYSSVVLNGYGVPAGAVATVGRDLVTTACAPGASVPRTLNVAITFAAAPQAGSTQTEYGLVLSYDEGHDAWEGELPGLVLVGDALRFSLKCGGNDCSGFALYYGYGASGTLASQEFDGILSVSDPTGTSLDCDADPLELTFDGSLSTLGTARVRVLAPGANGETLNGAIKVEYYLESNLLLLGIPTVL